MIITNCEAIIRNVCFFFLAHFVLCDYFYCHNKWAKNYLFLFIVAEFLFFPSTSFDFIYLLKSNLFFWALTYFIIKTFQNNHRILYILLYFNKNTKKLQSFYSNILKINQVCFPGNLINKKKSSPKICIKFLYFMISHQRIWYS